MLMLTLVPSHQPPAVPSSVPRLCLDHYIDYQNVQDDGYLNLVEKVDGPEFIRRQVGMVKEVLTRYGPVNRFWFDRTSSFPQGGNKTDLWDQVYETIRTVSPDTMITSYRGV